MVNSEKEYESMLKSFLDAGFDTSFCEYLYLNNIKGNNWDAFTGFNKAIHIANGEYLILCHQDVRIEFDNVTNLFERIDEISSLDSNWCVLGNAGGASNLHDVYIRISDPNMENVSKGPFPTKVECLDENFIILNAKYGLRFSEDLSGYHFYGTDICQQARFRGLNSYVINFHLRHLSSGKTDSIYESSFQSLIHNYRNKLAPRFMRETTNLRLYLTGSKWKSII